MRRSTREMYLVVLKVLSQRSPLILTHIMYRANINCCKLKGCLETLIKMGLIEKIAVRKNRMVYHITCQGKAVVRNYREITQSLPILEVYSEVCLDRVIC